MSQNADFATVVAPITERILARVGPPKWLWITLWALVPLVSPFIYGAAIRVSGLAFGDRDINQLGGAAQSLEARASDLLAWPIDEGTMKFMAVVVTGVVTSLVVRGLFAALGF